MNERHLSTLRIFLMLIVASESAVIVRRGLPKEGLSGEGEIPLETDTLGKDKKLGLNPEVWDPEVGGDDYGTHEFDMGVNDPHGQPSDYDYMKPAEGDNSNEIDTSKPEIKPEKIPTDIDYELPGEEHNDTGDETDVHKNIGKEDDFDKAEDDGFYEPFDGEEDLDKSIGDKDSKLPTDDDESIHKDVDESHHSEEDDERVFEEDNDKEEHETVDEDKEYEEKDAPDRDDEDEDKDVPVGDDEISDDEHDKDEDKDDKRIPVGDDEHGKNDEDIGGGKEKGLFGRGSIFDTPFFNLNQIQKYFGQLERALGHVFSQTLDEVRLLNDTYTNTTEEEVDINGKKYIVQKTMIKGADNHSSIYVESLTSKVKPNDMEGINNTEVEKAII